MTKLQAKARAIKAAEMIASGEEKYLADVILEALLWYRFRDLFDPEEWTELSFLPSNESQNIKVLMLLTFAEVGIT